MFITFKVTQYKMSVELAGSINTLFTLQSYIYMFMTTGSFSCTITPFESRFKKPMTIGFPSFLNIELCDICITNWAYIFLVELVSPSTTKPPKMVLSVCIVTQVSRISSGFFPFLVEAFSKSESLLERFLFSTAPSVSFIYDNSLPLLIRVSIYLFK